MSSSKGKAEYVINKREAALAREIEARMEQDRQQLQVMLSQFTKFFTDTTRATLNRLECNDFPGGSLIMFPKEREKLAAWELPVRRNLDGTHRQYFLVSDGFIREFNPNKDYHLRWKRITPTSVRYEVLGSLQAYKSIEWGEHEIYRLTSIVEKCNLICPDKQPRWYKRIFAQ